MPQGAGAPDSDHEGTFHVKRYRGGMARILVTGMSGVGKSTVLSALSGHGYTVVDTDYGDWKTPDGLWDETRMADLLADLEDVVVSGAVDNQGRFYDRFDEVILLSVPESVLWDRIRSRSTNSYGRSAGERAEVAAHIRDVLPLLRATATRELDGTRDVASLAEEIAALVGTPPEHP